eukprot:356718-Chlamydomonas_euryale.AAC.2
MGLAWAHAVWWDFKGYGQYHACVCVSVPILLVGQASQCRARLLTSQDFVGFLGIGRTGLVFIPWGLHGHAHAVRSDFQDPWTAQALSFEATGSRGVLLSCA